jgi:hypothetical protein
MSGNVLTVMNTHTTRMVRAVKHRGVTITRNWHSVHGTIHTLAKPHGWNYAIRTKQYPHGDRHWAQSIADAKQTIDYILNSAA